ncbi:hypothetical protein C8J57DRAFT_1296632 [Mycena rebaudengoi]|nr:hypothetical protein C8J57DRAFT_1296632 [Mycena rebaudengoi]
MLARWCSRRLPTGFRRISVRKLIQKEELSLPPPPPLKGWQEDAVHACMDAIRDGHTKIGIHMTTGNGKIAALGVMLDLIPPPQQNPQATKILVLAISTQRAEKIVLELRKRYPRWKVDIYSKAKKYTSGIADATVTTYRNFSKEEVVHKFDPSMIKAIILDEAHHAQPPFYTFLLSRFDPDERFKKYGLPKHSHCPIIIGTSSNDDYNALTRRKFFDEIVYRRDFVDSVQDNWECAARFSAAPAPIGLKAHKSIHGSHLQTGPLSLAMRSPPVIEATIQAWRDVAVTRISTLIYCVDDHHAHSLATAFQESTPGVDARRISQSGSDAAPGSIERLAYDTQLAAFEAGDFPVLLVVSTKTIPIPRIDCILLASPSLNLQLVANRIQSGMKASPETQKEDTLIIEVVDSDEKPSLVQDIRILLQLPAKEIDGETISVLRTRAERNARKLLSHGPPREPEIPPPPPPPEPKPLIPVKRTNSAAMIAQEKEEQEDDTLQSIIKVSKQIWVRCAPLLYIHDCLQRGHVIVRGSVNNRGLLEFAASYTPRRLDGLPDTQLMPPAQLIYKGDLELVLRQVAAFLGRRIKKVAFKTRLLRATFEQQSAIREFYPPTIPTVLVEENPMERDEYLSWFSTGDASNVLARLRYNSDPDFPTMTAAEQAVVVTRIASGREPWLKAERIKKIMTETRLQKRQKRRTAKADKKLKKRELKAMRNEKKAKYTQHRTTASSAQSPDSAQDKS